MSWIMLIIAGVLEICWSLGLKYTKGFTVLIPSVFTIAAMVVSMYTLALATKDIPVGTAYAVWVGIGALGASIGGVLLFQESVSVSKVIFMAMLLISIVGLKLSSK